MMQNHMLQPAHADCHGSTGQLEYDASDEKVRVLKAISPMEPEMVKSHVIRGQYGEGVLNGRRVPLRAEDRVSSIYDGNLMAMKVKLRISGGLESPLSGEPKADAG